MVLFLEAQGHIKFAHLEVHKLTEGLTTFGSNHILVCNF